jgi:arylsulfatase A-like enzyme
MGERGKWAVWVFAGLWALLFCCLSQPATASPAKRPNIIVVVTDDQAASTFTPRVMPKTFDLIVRNGVRFERSIVGTPLCCPSRATFLSGQYGHNNGVLWNIPGYGALGDPGNTLPVWLRRAGYRTVHIGKYLNLYSEVAADPGAVPPGWAEWHTMLDPVRYYGFTYAEDGQVRTLDDDRAHYATKVFNREAVRTIRQLGSRPLFMVVDQLAPHRWPGPVGKVAGCPPAAPEPAPRDGDLFAHHRLPRPPSFNEPDVADKPSFIRDRPQFDRSEIDAIRTGYRCGLASLRAVDRGVGQIWRELGKAGERRNTAIIFTSDNGFYYGEHRINVAKEIPYRESVEVPLAIRLPPSMSGRVRKGGSRVRRLVANVDLPASIVDLAGAEPCSGAGYCRTLDGRSLVGLARGRGRGFPKDRAIPLELDVGFPRAPRYISCRYQGIWVGEEVMISHASASGGNGLCAATDEWEYYDLRSDPFQLQSEYPAPAGTPLAARQAALIERIQSLASCSGIEQRDPPPFGRDYCE